VGVWIEIEIILKSLLFIISSLPSWECGLKFRISRIYN